MLLCVRVRQRRGAANDNVISQQCGLGDVRPQPPGLFACALEIAGCGAIRLLYCHCTQLLVAAQVALSAMIGGAIVLLQAYTTLDPGGLPTVQAQRALPPAAWRLV